MGKAKKIAADLSVPAAAELLALVVGGRGVKIVHLAPHTDLLDPAMEPYFQASPLGVLVAQHVVWRFVRALRGGAW